MSAPPEAVARARAVVASFVPLTAGQAAARAATLTLLDSTPEPLGRQDGGHVTGSALVVDAAAARVLVLWHKKLGLWVQPGGHVDGDGDLARSALREAEEETGMAGLRLLAGPPVDVDVHHVSPPDAPPHDHHDVRFVVLAPPGAEPVANAEADRFRWLTGAEVEADAGCDDGLRRLTRLGLARAARPAAAATFAGVATVVFLHAHPDDECLSTGGTMARLAAEGHRVVLVTATDGAQGEVPDGLLAEGETLAARRAREVEASAKALGVASLHLLGYPDSGMAGTEANAAPGAFCRVDVEEAAARVAELLDEEGADVLVTYDDHGTYGHPDHIQVHHVGLRAAEMAGTPSLYQATVNRDEVQRLMAVATELGLLPADADETPTEEELATLGTPASEITTTVDVGGFLDAKLAAMRCHETQVGDMDFFFKMPEDAFRQTFSREYYVRMRAPAAAPVDHLV